MVCRDCKHWYAEGNSPYGTCGAEIPRWVFEQLVEWRLALEEPRIRGGEYTADECESFEEGET